jgi:hypothetical protein
MTASDAQTISLCDLLSLAEPEEREAWDNLTLGYTETWGSPALRRAVAATYAGLAAEDILCFAGAEEGLYCAMLALLDPDDHAIVTVPNYQSMETVPVSICGSVSGVALRAENGWALDLDDVRAALRPNTRLIAVNFPTTRPVRSPAGRPSTASSRCAPSAASTCLTTRSIAGWSATPHANSHRRRRSMTKVFRST